jgi:molybdate transport system substrate-binding protein
MRLSTTLQVCAFGIATLMSGTAFTADLVILSNQGAIPGVRALAEAFEEKTGHTVDVVQATDEDLQQRTRDGSADLVTGNPGNVVRLVEQGVVVADTVRPFVMAGLGLSVQAGAPKPDISTVEAYVAALRAAESIGYSDGCSGTNVGRGIAELGLTAELAPKTTITQTGPVTDYVARGDVEIGIQQTNIMVDVPGTDYVGPLPGFLNKMCQSDVALIAASREPEAAREMIAFMASPEAAPFLRQTFVEPYTP